ncbi:DgyrCDS8343 [Dimorphilus gyrociliatus]|uniref:N-acyl-aliphatic-L-amino acid amidohydrolase n=1 Tax=Dimorphilus gyrociliatus TaxID=2664684 RepID=A0A7I8VU38_9ANNE|nr:DgyrCDS8343 [Dimorphilus gyrociliatus]
MSENPATTLFREYLRIKSVQPKPDYDGVVKFLTRISKELDLPMQVIELVKGKPIIVITWKGENPSLPSVLLNSHTDVVPVFPEYWKHDPFSAHKEENGDIYARGSQDMKCVGIQHIEAVRRLKSSGFKPLRTIHLCFVPDEEIGGIDGVKKWVDEDSFKQLNVGLSLDEGLASESSVVPVYYGERAIWWVNVTCLGQPGHGSQFLPDNAGKKIRHVIDSFMNFRDEEEKRLKSDKNLTLGDVTTVNLTILEGGVQQNVVPAQLNAKFDVRITPHLSHDKVREMIDKWLKEAGEGVSYNFLQYTPEIKPSELTGKWYDAVSSSLNESGVPFKPEIFPAATDSRYFRAKGIQAYGISYMPETPILLHDHNERLNEAVFLKGIDVFENLVKKVSLVN